MRDCSRPVMNEVVALAYSALAPSRASTSTVRSTALRSCISVIPFHVIITSLVGRLLPLPVPPDTNIRGQRPCGRSWSVVPVRASFSAAPAPPADRAAMMADSRADTARHRASDRRLLATATRPAPPGPPNAQVINGRINLAQMGQVATTQMKFPVAGPENRAGE